MFTSGPPSLLPRASLWFRANVAICIATLATLVGTAIFWSPPFWFDEIYHVRNVELLIEKGFGLDFLRSLNTTTGPLFAVIHYATQSLSGLSPKGVRLVNIALFICLLWIVAGFFRRLKIDHPLATSLFLLAIPMYGGVVGTAMTEIPAMIFLYASLLWLDKALITSLPNLACFQSLIGGLLFGISVCGRQQFLPLLAAFGLAIFQDRPKSARYLLFIFSALILPIALFLVWQGTLPPSHAHLETSTGVSWGNGISALGYGAIVYSIFSPQWLWLNWKFHLAITIVVSGVNLSFNLITRKPLMTVMQKLITNNDILHLFHRFAGGLLASLGIIFALKMVRQVIRHPDPWQRSLIFLTIVFMLTPLKIEHYFTGRYIIGATPLLLWLAEKEGTATGWKTFRIALGSLLLLLSLWTYYSNAEQFSP